MKLPRGSTYAKKARDIKARFGFRTASWMTRPCAESSARVVSATKIKPSSAQALQNSPFSVTLACVQVRPERYQTTGSLTPFCYGGTKTEKVMPVPVSRLACL